MPWRQRASRFLQFAPTRRLALLVAIAAPVWFASGSDTGRVIAVGLTVIIVLAIAVDVITMPHADSVEVTRAFPMNVGVGDHAAGQYELFSRWPRALMVSLSDRLPSAIAANATLAPALPLPPSTKVRVTREFVGVHRGDHLLGPVAIRVNGRFGLLTRTVVYELEDTIRGIPSVTQVRLYRLLSIQHRMRAPGVRAVRRRGEGRSFESLREYAHDDDPRHIDWKATARRGKLITREYAVEQGQQVLMVIDAGRMMTQFAGSQPRFEYALSSALVLADIAAHGGDAVGVVVFDDAVRRYVAPAKGPAAVRSIRDALTAAEATLVEPDYAAAFRTIAARQRNRALIVLFTDVLDVRSSHTLIAHLMRSATRHLPLVVALRSEELTAAALPANRHASGEIFEAAAAEELLIARETALAKMRAAGVSVVNVAPTAMTAAVVNRYLDIKARAAL